MLLNKEVKIFAAQDYVKSDDGNTTGAGDETGTVKLYQLKYVPANQGVVLYAPPTTEVDATTKTALLEFVEATDETVPVYNDKYEYIKDWATASETDKTAIWAIDHSGDGEPWQNYLVPVLGQERVLQNAFDSDNKWIGRNFSFTRYSTTKTGKNNKVQPDDENDHFGFYRFNGTVTPNHAYLSLPLDKMTSNGQILDQKPDNTDAVIYAKSMYWLEGIDGEWNNGTTGIKEVNAEVKTTDNLYYNLQGQKVTNPTKGLYIHNGKKVILK